MKNANVSGWVILDKAVGLGSTKAVSAVRRAFGAAKAGHGGTLDPLASGILPIALGEATKTVQWAMGASKRYRLTIRWGIATATDDAEGAVTATSDVRPTELEIRGRLAEFTGTIMQVPASFSAIHVNGRRAYDLARAGLTPVLEPRQVQIDSIEILPGGDPDHTTLEVVCGKGVYMRSLGRDLAVALGTVGHLSALRRLQVGRFSEAHAISLENLEQLRHTDRLSEHLLPIETALDDIPALALTEAEALRLRQGQKIRPLSPTDRARIDLLGDGRVVSVFSSQKLVAITELNAGELRPMRVLNL